MTTALAPPALAAPPPAAIDVPLDDAERAKRIRVAVRGRSRQLRERYPILRHQDALGAGILAVSTLAVIGTAAAYITGVLAWWLAVPIAAFFMGIAHEIEHDAIHRLYFTRNKPAQHVMFAVVWLLRPYTISPWARRPLHLLHHEQSGSERDLEEKGITNGEPWNLKRLVTMIDPLANVVLRLPKDPAKRAIKLRFVAKAWFPLTYVALAIWYGFLGLGLAHLVTGGSFAATGVPATVLGVLQVLTVVWIAPNVLRVACLHFISSNMHYYGDVEAGNVIQQTQVLNRWWLVPAQLFCANFGSTHGIHHFVPNDPFYVRQLTAKVGHQVMREHGVRFNDLGTFRRANRFATAS